jgi:hypothetical protein
MVDPDMPGGCLRRHLLVGGHAYLDSDAFGRVQPAPGAQRAAGPAGQCTQSEFSQAELEQQGRHDRHQPEGLRCGRAARGVRPVEGARGGNQAPDGQAGGEARFGPGRAAHEQHCADTGRAVQREEQQVRPGAAQLHIGAGEAGQALRGDPRGDGREPAQQDILSDGRGSFPRVHVLAGHRSGPQRRKTLKLNTQNPRYQLKLIEGYGAGTAVRQLEYEAILPSVVIR